MKRPPMLAACFSDATVDASCSSDCSVLEDLLAKLEDFPCVPNESSEVFPSPIYHAEDRLSKKNSPSVTPLVIDTTLGNTFQALSSDEAGVESDAFLHTSQSLHAYVLFFLSRARSGFEKLCNLFPIAGP
jgi:hypothetical protein